MNKLVSIVVPIYNMEESIEICVQSLVEQTYNNIEIILVDDGSKDNSYKKCIELKEIDSRISVIHTENRGSGTARNAGIDAANGEYIYFPDADDKIEKNAIEIMVEKMEDSLCDLLVFGYTSIAPSGDVKKIKNYIETIESGNDIRNNYSDYVGAQKDKAIQGAPWNKCFRLDIIKKNKLYYPSLRRHQDEGFIARYMCHTNTVQFINDVLYIHFTNDLKKEWDKYPIDYIDAVIGLNSTRKETILKWNPDDTETRVFIEHEYICNTVKAIELSFSPKMKLNHINRKKWIIDAIAKSNIESYPTDNLQVYQRIILNLIKNKCITVLMIVMFIKTKLERYGFIDRIKKIKSVNRPKV